jgi:hypothetical protein
MNIRWLRAQMPAPAAALAADAACARGFPARAIGIVVPFPADIDAHLRRKMETNGKIIHKPGLEVD